MSTRRKYPPADGARLTMKTADWWSCASGIARGLGCPWAILLLEIPPKAIQRPSVPVRWTPAAVPAPKPGRPRTNFTA